MYKSEKFDNIQKQIGWFNYFTVILSAEVINQKENKTLNDLKIVEQFLIRLNGKELADTCLKYMFDSRQKSFDTRLLYSQIKKKLLKPQKIFLYEHLFQLFIYGNIETSSVKYMFNLSCLFLINKKQYDYIKYRIINEEQKYQSGEQNSKERQRGDFQKYNSSKDIKYYYKILEIEPSATNKEVKKAFRRLAHMYHPDKESHNSNSTNMKHNKNFKELVEAYERIKLERKIK